MRVTKKELEAENKRLQMENEFYSKRNLKHVYEKHRLTVERNQLEAEKRSMECDLVMLRLDHDHLRSMYIKYKKKTKDCNECMGGANAHDELLLYREEHKRLGIEATRYGLRLPLDRIDAELMQEA